MAFFQDPPRLENTFTGDALLAEYLARVLPPPVVTAITPELEELGAAAAGSLVEMQRADRLREPTLTQWDAWGRRVDRIEVTPLWQEAAKIAARHGLVAAGYEKTYGEHARVHQFVMNYLVDASIDVYSCPLAMTDGAARTLLDAGNQAIVERALPRLTSRDPAVMWTAGQWMTERTGGSDVGLSETVARQTPEGWRLFGTKWFTSATTSQVTLTLARPEGNGPGGKGLALFYLELHDAEGRWNGISVNRLKDKLGTRKVPTAELTLDGALATPVVGLSEGIRHITPMLGITRIWNAIGAAGGMRRAVSLAQDYARRRAQFGALLVEKPLHRDTLAQMIAEADGAFLITFRAIELLGGQEAGVATEEERRLLRILTPLVKLTTGKQAVATASETLEAFGGAGYVEDTGLPRLLRDAQVLPIWEGTTNVLSLDTLRALRAEGTIEALESEIAAQLGRVKDARLAPAVEAVKQALGRARTWMGRVAATPPLVEAGARRFAMTLGRSTELALACAHAQWCLDTNRGTRALASARWLLRNGIDRIGAPDDAVADADAVELV
jgi:alkylation response protein AidB-like acyl-CoA dehydrogenase